MRPGNPNGCSVERKGGGLAEAKTEVVASDKALAQAVAQRIALPQAPVNRMDLHARFLGGDYSAGVPRRRGVGRTDSQRQTRMAKARLRRRHLRRLRLAGGGQRTRLIAATGLVPHCIDPFGAESDVAEPMVMQQQCRMTVQI